jgi:hypothetical protein
VHPGAVVPCGDEGLIAETLDKVMVGDEGAIIHFFHLDALHLNYQRIDNKLTSYQLQGRDEELNSDDRAGG